jgi:GNAT superfamily N-acetyltransferase
MEIRPADPADHEGVVDLLLTRFRAMTAALVVEAVAGAAESGFRRLLVVVEGDRLVGTGLMYRAPNAPPGTVFEFVAVDGDAEGRGVGGALEAALGSDLPPWVTAAITQVDRDDARSLEVAGHWAFAPLEVSVTSRAELAGAAPPVPPDDVTAEVSPSLEFGDEDDVEKMLDVSQTNPERDHGLLMTLAGLRAMASEGGAAPTGVVLRVDGRPAAITYALTARDEAQVVYTGVDPELRGRGLARLAKEVLHAELAAAGVRTCVTNNADDNAGIRHVNDRLGYRPTDAAVYHRRAVGGE